MFKGYFIKTSIIRIFILFVSVLTFSLNVKSQVLIPFRDEMSGKYGFLNDLGEVVIKAEYKEVKPFNGGVAIAENWDGNFYINKSGKIIVKNNIGDILYDFSCGFGRVTKCEDYWKSYFYDKTGKLIKHYVTANSFSDNIAIVSYNNKIYAVNTSFKILFEINIPYDRISKFQNGMMVIENINGMKGYMDKNGKIAIKPNYLYAGNFSDGYAVVTIKENYIIKHFLIDKKGDLIFEILTEDYDFEPNRVLLHNNKLIYSPKNSIVNIVNLSDLSVIKITVNNEYFNKRYIDTPKLLGEYIFCYGSAFDFEGNIVWKINNYESTEEVYYNKYILINTNVYGQEELYRFDGVEINYP